MKYSKMAGEKIKIRGIEEVNNIDVKQKKKGKRDGEK
jgi:hypothetical protein